MLFELFFCGYGKYVLFLPSTVCSRDSQCKSRGIGILFNGRPTGSSDPEMRNVFLVQVNASTELPSVDGEPREISGTLGMHLGTSSDAGLEGELIKAVLDILGKSDWCTEDSDESK